MIEFRLLGSVDLKGSEGETLRSVLAQPKRVALLAYLAVATPSGYHRRDKLLGLFWPESDQEHGRGALRKALYFLRQSLGEEVIVSRGDEEIGLAEGAVWCDAVAFEQTLEQGEPEKALELYRGAMLDGFHVSGVPEFERWLESERQRLADRYAEVLETLASASEAAGDLRRAVDWRKRLASHDPYNSRYTLQLMEAMVEAGDPGNAIQHAREHARLLREELEAEPAQEVLELAERLKREAGVSADAKERRAFVRGPTAAEPTVESPPRSLLFRLSRPLAFYATASFAVLVVAHIFTLQFGLPDWFFRSVVVLLFACLPVVIATASLAGTPGARGWVSWRRSVGLIALAFGFLGLAVTGYMAMRVLGIGPWGTLIATGVLQERDMIVLADFEDHTGETLGLTVTEVLREELGQSRVVTVAGRGFVRQVLEEQMGRDPDVPLTYGLAREVAIRKGLKAVVAGAISRLGSSYVLSARIVAAETGEELYSHQETAEGLDPIMSAINRLSARLLERIGESLRTVRGGRGTSSFAWTPSLEAARLYTESVRAGARGEFSKAVDRTSQAIQIDSLFASAYSTRAMALFRLGIGRAQIVADFMRAYELRHRAPAWGRYFIEAEYHRFVTGDREKLIEAYSRILEREPGWSPTSTCPCPAHIVGAANNLGLTYYGLRDYARAEEMFRWRLAMDSARGSRATAPWINLTRILFDQGRIDEAEEALRQWQARMPGNPDIGRVQAEVASAQGDYEAAAVYLRSWRDRQSESLLRQARFNGYMASLAQVQGALAEAESYLRRAMALYEEGGRVDDYLVTGVQLASLHVWFLGDTIGALETVAAALGRQPLDSIEPLDRPYSELAGFYAVAGAPERAREALLEWETVVPTELRRTQEVSRRNAWGAVALAEGQAEDALAEYRFVQERGCTICALPLQAQAYEIAGQADSAMALYEQYLTTPWVGRVRFARSPAVGVDPYWLPIVYERLGDLYEQRADTAKAIYYYGKLVELWKDADPELQPRVEAARRAIEALSPAR